MVDLGRQYDHISYEVDHIVSEIFRHGSFIQGSEVTLFEENLSKFLGVNHVVTCANGTDALKIALMALNLEPGDEIIVPTFTYVASAEMIALLGLRPILVDVFPDTFNINICEASKLLTDRTRAIIPVHLFGQCADMDSIMNFARIHNLFVIEDAAQAIGAEVIFSDGSSKKAGTIGHIGTTSFFPSKNLGCYGDGGAIFTNDKDLAVRLKMITNHGQKVKYYHDIIGVNSRLDTLQAGILGLKLKYLDSYTQARQIAANFYDNSLASVGQITIPHRSEFSTHVFHQYTIKIDSDFSRDELKKFLSENGIPSMIYYPLPLHHQKAFKGLIERNLEFPISNSLCKKVLSLPMHTHLKIDELEYIVLKIKNFFKSNK